MYNKNKDSLLKDVLSPTVIGLAVAIHLLIVFLFCAVSSSSEKEVEETLNDFVEELEINFSVLNVLLIIEGHSKTSKIIKWRIKL